MKNNFWWGFIIVLILAFIAGMHFQQKPAGEIIRTDTIYKLKTDSIKTDSLIAKEVIKTKVIKDTLYNTDSIPVLVQVPITSSYYDSVFINKDDTTHFKAYISGYRTSLDSLWLTTKVKEKETIITQYITKKKTFIERFHLQPQVTSGYDLVNKRWGIVVGVGIGYDI